MTAAEALERGPAEAVAESPETPRPVSPFESFTMMVMNWRRAQIAVNHARFVADSEYARRVLEASAMPELKNTESRKAYADQMTADLFRRLADAEAEAASLKALVEYFINPRRSS